jgi:hypothetical protein
MSNQLRWYGYRHQNGTLHVKRFVGHFGSGDMVIAKNSPFVTDVFGPFDAQNQHAANKTLEKIAARHKENL